MGFLGQGHPDEIPDNADPDVLELREFWRKVATASKLLAFDEREERLAVMGQINMECPQLLSWFLLRDMSKL